MSPTTKASAVLIVLLVLGALLQRWLAPDPAVTLPPAVVESHAIDSGAVRDSIAREQLRDSARIAAAAEARAAQEARSARRSADSLRRALAAVLRDSGAMRSAPAETQAAYWQDAYALARAEADTLRAESAAKDVQIDLLTSALQWTQLERDQLAARLEASDRVRRQLAEAVAAADPPCRISLLVTSTRCPTRTEAVVGVLVARELVRLFTN